MVLAESAENTEKENLDELTFKVRGAIFEVFKELGPGLLESVYEAALRFELTSKNIGVQFQLPVPVLYKSLQLDIGFRLDLLVEDKIIIEVKSVESLHDIHKKQLLNYLKLTGKKVGILVNFNSAYLKDKESIFRIVNNY
jgi:GxxExxY protein